MTEGLSIALSCLLLSKLLLLSNPSVSFADSSLYSREPILKRYFHSREPILTYCFKRYFYSREPIKKASLVQREVAWLCHDGGIVNCFKLYAIA